MTSGSGKLHPQLLLLQLVEILAMWWIPAQMILAGSNLQMEHGQDNNHPGALHLNLEFDMVQERPVALVLELS